MSNEAKAEHMLDEAKRLVSGSRNDDYGPPDVDMAKVAGMMNHLFGWDVKPSQVPMIMILIKLARESHSSKHDNAVDIAGWAWCMDECVKSKEPEGFPFPWMDEVDSLAMEALAAECGHLYEPLEPDELIQKGDEWRIIDSSDAWKPTINHGLKHTNHDYLEYRRKIS